jgi:hypothetical protein
MHSPFLANVKGVFLTMFFPIAMIQNGTSQTSGGARGNTTMELEGAKLNLDSCCR